MIKQLIVNIFSNQSVLQIGWLFGLAIYLILGFRVISKLLAAGKSQKERSKNAQKPIYGLLLSSVIVGVFTGRFSASPYSATLSLICGIGFPALSLFGVILMIQYSNFYLQANQK
ncbi:MAG TPA: hypothetical protein VMN57_12360 [Anaerolineales bacterium]|nr:hypothetical protein [Anaerolineales bacterium]